MPANAQAKFSSSTPRPTLQDSMNTLRFMSPQGGQVPVILCGDGGEAFQHIAQQLGSALPEYSEPVQPEYLPSEKVENTGPPTGYTVERESLPTMSRISVPLNPDGANQSECLVTNAIKKKILSTPGFPVPLTQPPKAYRIGSAPGKGLGIFATRDLDMGDLICMERPLLVLPSYVNIQLSYPSDWTKDEVKRAMMFEWDKECRRVFERLDPGAQAAYLALPNIHTEDGSGTTLGICRTNGFAIEGLADTVGTHKASYSGICKDFSRANHSCRPNITRYFDRKAFAFRFSATRPIKCDEEITIGYIFPQDPRSVRQQDLQKYQFICDCPACGPGFKVSDKNRVDIAASVDDLLTNYKAWVKDKALAKDELIKTSHRWIQVIESEGLECMEFYDQHLKAIYNAYIALGDKENTIKYGTLIGKRCRAFGELKLPIKSYSDPNNFQSRSDWAIRGA